MSTKFVRPRIRREQYCLVHLLLPVLLGLEPVGGILDPPGHLLVLPTSQLLSLQHRIRMSFYLETGYRTHCGFMRIRIGIHDSNKSSCSITEKVFIVLSICICKEYLDITVFFVRI